MATLVAHEGRMSLFTPSMVCISLQCGSGHAECPPIDDMALVFYSTYHIVLHIAIMFIVQMSDKLLSSPSNCCQVIGIAHQSHWDIGCVFCEGEGW